MKIQYSAYFILIFCIHIFGLYYTFIFCSIYIKSIKGWIEGVIVSLILDFGITAFFIPLSLAIFRKILQILIMQQKQNSSSKELLLIGLNFFFKAKSTDVYKVKER